MGVCCYERRFFQPHRHCNSILQISESVISCYFLFHWFHEWQLKVKFMCKTFFVCKFNPRSYVDDVASFKCIHLEKRVIFLLGKCNECVTIRIPFFKVLNISWIDMVWWPEARRDFKRSKDVLRGYKTFKLPREI